MFRKILIANRGEIAVRVIRTCRRLGISPVAVFSEADRHALHVRMADAALAIGPAPAARSYLNIEAVLSAARQSGAEAIHPGYGFLAENPEFARACSDAGIVFIGPDASAMRKLGNKVAARKRMAAAGVPVVPGLSGSRLTVSRIRDWAKRAGYPVLLKAAAGGGGRGMRIVRSPEELADAFAAARSEALSAFGDGTVFAERYLEESRHIEVQVLMDRQGRGVSLGERECSIQRRHQKLVEETPSPVVDERIRRRLGSYALKACRAARYLNAGTVEFIRDARGRFYFLEINARLQVEHPITEAVTGVDLVESQIRIAAGAPLDLPSRPLRPRGWALECRIQAEDPAQDFRPSPGKILLYRPSSGPGVRVDSGVTEGDEVSLHYDSLLAKLIASGRNREEAIGRMAQALSEFRIAGIPTTLAFHRRVMGDPAFRTGGIDTGYVRRLLAQPEREPEAEAQAAALVAAAHLRTTAAGRRSLEAAAAPDFRLRAGRGTGWERGFPRDPWRLG
ncbi:MAG TPA: acetyl-CoA carboxylase biotin carboxylase subunit [Candidatus Polarisedimenticolia bacterium]|jgi:acetyl-CoA carboxylase biotin carboxylase subunit|nr:acetyl-CoA carboxylase biotin carboxylase subunit [Candidatus Polarisedimenticolia bacterium]